MNTKNNTNNTITRNNDLDITKTSLPDLRSFESVDAIFQVVSPLFEGNIPSVAELRKMAVWADAYKTDVAGRNRHTAASRTLALAEYAAASNPLNATFMELLSAALDSRDVSEWVLTAEHDGQNISLERNLTFSEEPVDGALNIDARHPGQVAALAGALARIHNSVLKVSNAVVGPRREAHYELHAGNNVTALFLDGTFASFYHNANNDDRIAWFPRHRDDAPTLTGLLLVAMSPASATARQVNLYNYNMEDAEKFARYFRVQFAKASCKVMLRVEPYFTKEARAALGFEDEPATVAPAATSLDLSLSL